MKLLVQQNTTGVLMLLFAQDNSVTTGAGLGSVAFNSASISAYYYRQGDASSTSISLATMSLGTWATGGLILIDNTNMKGALEIGLPNACFTQLGEVIVIISGVASLAPIVLAFQVVSFNPNDAVRLGLTSLPSAAVGSGANSFNFDSAGNILSDPQKWLSGTIPSPNTTGVPLVDTKYVTGTLQTARDLGASVLLAGDFSSTMKTSLNSSTPAGITGSVNGNVAGTVGSVLGSVNNVVGSVGSIAAAGISNTSFSAACWEGVTNYIVLSGTGTLNGSDITGNFNYYQVQQGKPAFTNGFSYYYWYSAADTAWILSIALGTKGTNYFQSANASPESALTGHGSTTGPPVATVNTPLVSLVAAGLNNVIMPAISSVPTITDTLLNALGWIFAQSRNKITETASTQLVRNDADSGTIGTSTVSDDGTTFTRGKFS